MKSQLREKNISSSHSCRVILRKEAWASAFTWLTNSPNCTRAIWLIAMMRNIR